MCAAAQAETLLRRFSKPGAGTGAEGAQDKYEQALLMAVGKMESKTSEMEFIEDIFEGDW